MDYEKRKISIVVSLSGCICVVLFLLYNQLIKETTRRVKNPLNDFLIPLNDKCNFDGYQFSKNHENGECSVAYFIIPLVSNVIEIGGGTGKISHVINSLLKDKTQHIVIEPGDWYGDVLMQNKSYFDDKYTIVSKKAEDVILNDLSVLNSLPNCLFVDCEGCLKEFFKTTTGHYILSHVKYIVNEMDGHNDDLRTLWSTNGFVLKHTGSGCDGRCSTEVWVRD